jgi:hypothetical protein
MNRFAALCVAAFALALVAAGTTVAAGVGRITNVETGASVVQTTPSLVRERLRA